MTNNDTAPAAFSFNQPVTLDGFTCGCYHQHRIHGSFRRYDDFGMVEVFTCRGSLIANADAVHPA